jgi:hypothetical protein
MERNRQPSPERSVVIGRRKTTTAILTSHER